MKAWLVALALSILGAVARAQEPACAPGDAAATATVRAVIDGRTLALDDGRTVRLAAIDVPPPFAAGATAALAALVDGREVALSPLAPAADRYGRRRMRAFVNPGGKPLWVEAALAARGLALAAPGSDPACRAALRAAERAARTARIGLWNPAARLGADDPAAVLRGRGGFALVEGKVLSVRESGGTIYLNFGRRWTEDFTVTILKRNGRRFMSEGLDPKGFQGHRVRVRGYVEARGGPWIEAASPDQIELADEP